MAINSANEMDTLVWTQVSDQFGDIQVTGSDYYSDLTVETIDGVTYVVLTSTDGDVELYRYNLDTQSLTMLATHRGSNSTSNETLRDMNDPQLMSVDGKIAIVGGDESGNLMAYTYDPALGDSTVDNDNRLVEELSFETSIFGKGRDESFQFQAGNGETYMLFQQGNGSYDGGQVTTDASGNLTWDAHVVSGRDADNVLHNALFQETHSTIYAADAIHTSGLNGASFVQIDDNTVYEYVAATGATRSSAIKIVKWQVDETTGQLSGSQVLYSDGTTYQDLNDAGYTTHPYPDVSPFDGTSGPLDWDYLYDVSGLVPQNTASATAGDVDEGQLRNIMNAEAFTVDGKQYLFIGGYVTGGASIYEIDPVTGMPSTFIDHVESASSSTSDDDDDWFSTGEEWNDITVQRVDASGEYVITVLGQSSAVHFGFDPNGGHSSTDPNSTGALTWLGTEGDEKTATSIKNYDTDGNNYLGWTDPNSNTSQLNGYEILPDGRVIAVNDQGIWLADAGVTDVKSLSAGDYIVTGTSGNDLIDGTYTGDPDGDIVDNNDGNPNSPGVGDDDSIVAGDGNDTINGGLGSDTMLGEGGDDTFVLTDGDGCDSIVGGETGETSGDTLDASALTSGVNVTMTGAEAGTLVVGGAGATGITSTDGAAYIDPTSWISGTPEITEFSYPDGSASAPADNVSLERTDNPDLEHMVINGTDYLVASATNGLQIFEVDPVTGALTQGQSLLHIDPYDTTNVDTRDMVAQNIGHQLTVFNVTSSDGTEVPMMMAQGKNGAFLYRYDDATGQWSQTDHVNPSDLGTGLPENYNLYGQTGVHTTPDGTTYLYYGVSTGGLQGITRFELSGDTGTIDNSTSTYYHTPNAYHFTGMRVVSLEDGTARIISTRTDNRATQLQADDNLIVFDVDANGDVQDSLKSDFIDQGEVSTHEVGQLMLREENFVDPNGNIVLAGGGRVTIIDSATNTLIASYDEPRINHGVDFSLDDQGNLYVSGRVRATSTNDQLDPYTVVLDLNDYSIVAEGAATGAQLNYSQIDHTGPGQEAIFVTTTSGESFYYEYGGTEATTVGGDSSQWIAMTSSSLAEASLPAGSGGGDQCATFEEIENLNLTDFDDTFVGAEGNDSVDGGAGNDSLAGGAGSDTLIGGEGSDTIDGGDGDDNIGIGGGDVASGGSGDDLFVVDPSLSDTGPITVVGGETGEDLTDPTNGGAGDTLDLRGLQNVQVVYDPNNPEAGTATYTNDDGQVVTINFSEIENVLTDPNGDYIVTGTSGDDTINGSYMGDPDGDIVDNNDGNPNSPNVGDDDSIVAGSGNDLIDGQAGNDTMLGEGGDDTFLNVEGDGCDSIVGGETEETTGDTLDLSGATAGVSITYTGAEAGTFGFDGDGAASSSGTVTATGTDPYLDPTNVYSGYGFISTDLLVGHTDNDDLEHIVVDGQDYIIMSGSTGVEIWSMDGTTGELTKSQTLALPETSNQGRSGIDLVNMTNGAGETNTFMYVQSLNFTNVFSLDASTGQWSTVAGYNYGDMPSSGGDANTGFAGHSEVLTVADGTTYIYQPLGYSNIATNYISRFELNPDTGEVILSSEQVFDTAANGGVGLGGISNGTQIVATDAGYKFLVTDGPDKISIFEMDDTGNILPGRTIIDLTTTGNIVDAHEMLQNDVFMDGNGNLIMASGYTGGNGVGNGGTILVIDPTDNSVLAQHHVANMGSGPTYSVDDNGNIYVTTTARSGVSDTSPHTTVIGGGDYSLLASGFDQDGGFIGTTTSADGGYYGAHDNILVTTVDGQNFLVQANAHGAIDGPSSWVPWITTSQSTLAAGSGGFVAGGTGVDECNTFEEIENLVLTEFDDTVIGSEGDDNITAGGGNDSVTAGGGDDTIDGGDGDDTIDGGAGNDSLIGGGGSDSLTGGEGTDTIDGGAGADTLDGGAGDDDIVAGGGDTALGGSGDDDFTIDASVPDTGPITIVGGETGEDLTDPTNGGDGDTLDLRGLQDVVVTYDQTDPTWDGTTSESGTVTFTNDAGQPVTVNFSEIENVLTEAVTGPDGIVDGEDFGENMFIGYNDENGPTDGGGDQITGGDDTIMGNGGNDVIDGNGGDDYIDGGADNDLIIGAEGTDTLLGGTGSDTIYGSDGLETGNADVIDGGAGDDDIYFTASDQVSGGSGDDEFLIDPTDVAGGMTVIDGGSDATDGNPDDTANGNSGDTLNLTGATSGVEITFTNDPEAGTVDGLDGDILPDISFSEIENVIATSNNDTIDGSAATGPLNVDAGAGDDSVAGGTGDDVIDGGDGKDTIDGGAGDDFIDFGVGDGVEDVSVLENGDGNDTIKGFEAPIDNGDGTYGPQDQLDVTGLTDPTTGDPVVTTDVTITPDGNGNTTLTFPDGTSVQLLGVTAPTTDPSDPATESWLNAVGIPSPTVQPNYIVEGTSGGDLINGSYIGDPEGDMVDANDNQTGTNDDSIEAGAGDDTVIAGAGDDTVQAGEGDDIVEGGAGNDSIFGFEGSDTVDGGDGDDYINTRTSPGTGVPDIGYVHPTDGNYSYPSDTDPNNDRDSVLGGDGNDTILTGDDADTIDGGTGADVIDAGFDADQVLGGAGADSIQGGEGADTIDGGDDDDVIYGGVSPLDPTYTESLNYEIEDVNGDTDTSHNSDYLIGGAGNDRIYGQDDSDTLEGGTGNDTLDGGIDDDVLTGGAGDDVLTGGQGNDVFTFDNDGNDTITDFGAGITGDPNDGTDQTDNDFVDLSAYYDGISEVRADLADDGILNQSNSTTNGGTVDYSDNTAMTGSLTLTGATAGDLTYDTTNVMCFTAGTLIKTIDGPKAAEEIRQGDLVWTKDDGFQPVRWIGTRRFGAEMLETHDNLRPIRIKAHSLGRGLPERDLLVSQQHRMLVNSRITQRMTDAEEVLVAAKHLLQVNGIDVDRASEGVTYIHFLFDRHQIVEAEGAETESLFTGPEALKTVTPEARGEILTIFPELSDMDHSKLPSVRPILSGRKGRKLAQRHKQNRKHLTQ